MKGRWDWRRAGAAVGTGGGRRRGEEWQAGHVVLVLVPRGEVGVSGLVVRACVGLWGLNLCRLPTPQCWPDARRDRAQPRSATAGHRAAPIPDPNPTRYLRYLQAHGDVLHREHVHAQPSVELCHLELAAPVGVQCGVEPARVLQKRRGTTPGTPWGFGMGSYI